MDFVEAGRREITSHLKKFLPTHLPRHSAQDIYHYALLPPGKLLRPLLVRSVAKDLGDYCPKAHTYLEFFVEVHHVYTLVHDDLPCMDNDLTRRGRPAVHQQFNEWKALLIGDGLNLLSFRILSLIESPQLPSLLRYITWSLGPKGLIHGQYQDLSMEMNQSFDKLMATHALKTSRLMQTALVGSAILVEDIPFKIVKDLHRLGEHLGVAFQFLDDLCELSTEELTDHEAQINPFLVHRNLCGIELRCRLQKIQFLLQGHQLHSIQRVLRDYFQKTNTFIMAREQNIRRHVGDDLLNSIQQVLHRLSLGDDIL